MDGNAGGGPPLIVAQSSVSLTTLEMTRWVLIAFLQSNSPPRLQAALIPAPFFKKKKFFFLSLLIPSLAIRNSRISPSQSESTEARTEMETLALCCWVQCPPSGNILHLHSWTAWLVSFHQHQALSKCAKILSREDSKIFLSHIATARTFMSNGRQLFRSQAIHF